MTSELRVGVVGTGMMGMDHVTRLTHRIAGTAVSAIIEPDPQRAAAAVHVAPSARAFTRIEDALDAGAADAIVIATPGQLHEPVLLPVLEAGLPVLCEKPLTSDPESSWRIVEAEQRHPHPLIQVGFMRRFDAEYRQLRELIAAGTAGELLLLHCVHRNAAVPDSYTEDMLITDSLVHELDVVPWLAGATIASIEVRRGRRNPNNPSHLNDPILALIELDNGVLADVEMNVSVQYGYQVATEAVFAAGIARIGQPAGLQLWHDGRLQVAEHQSFKTRFRQAFDAEVQDWADTARQGRIAGPSAWDAYTVTVACAAGVKALGTSGAVAVELPEKPVFYAGADTPGRQGELRW
jgi:myo-inositol 2-dehydrogenase / D-chiro-inositol 1-dehydrogenase